MKKSEGRDLELARLFAEQEEIIKKLTEALKQVQWGSCDACGNHMYCPLCDEQKESWWDSVKDCPSDEAIPGKHKADCIVGQALVNHEAK